MTSSSDPFSCRILELRSPLSLSCHLPTKTRRHPQIILLVREASYLSHLFVKVLCSSRMGLGEELANVKQIHVPVTQSSKLAMAYESMKQD